MTESPTTKGRRRLALGLACGLLAGPTAGAGPEDLGPIRVVGTLEGSEDLSAVARIDGRFVVASDEGMLLQELVPDGDSGSYRVGQALALADPGAELDIEALARDGRHLYVLGSHSAVRPRVDGGRAHAKNSERISTVRRDPTRRHLSRLTLTDGLRGPAEVEHLELWPLIRKNPVLGPFVSVPGKENGVDLEGLAVVAGRLFVGFRSPVLRGGYVPVTAFSFDAPARYELRFVDLGGLGVRSLAAVPEGLLLVGGSDYGREYRLFYWNGVDRLPGTDAARGILRDLGAMPTPPGGKPEGITVIRETAESYELLVVYDGLPNGSPHRLRVTKD